MPFVTALYRFAANDTEWRAWDDEIVAVQTDAAAGAGATVWRLAHHRSDVANADPSRIYFWYTPRPNVSPDGRWTLFTSNWEKTLGRDPAGDPGGAYRQDVFLVSLATCSSRRTRCSPAVPQGAARTRDTSIPRN